MPENMGLVSENRQVRLENMMGILENVRCFLGLKDKYLLDRNDASYDLTQSFAGRSEQGEQSHRRLSSCLAQR